MGSVCALLWALGSRVGSVRLRWTGDMWAQCWPPSAQPGPITAPAKSAWKRRSVAATGPVPMLLACPIGYCWVLCSRADARGVCRCIEGVSARRVRSSW